MVTRAFVFAAIGSVIPGGFILREAGGEFYHVGNRGRQINAGPAGVCSKIRSLTGL